MLFGVPLVDLSMSLRDSIDIDQFINIEYSLFTDLMGGSWLKLEITDDTELDIIIEIAWALRICADKSVLLANGLYLFDVKATGRVN